LFEELLQRYDAANRVYSAFDTLQKVFVIVFVIVENSISFAKLQHEKADVNTITILRT